MATHLSDNLNLAASDIAGIVRRGEVSALELAEASLRRIEGGQQTLNAFTAIFADTALEDAEAIGPRDPRPFAGVPIAVKDLLTPIAGRRQTQGSDLFGDFTPDHDSYVVRRLREAGFVIVGQTSTPEMGILPVTEPRRFGPTRNPWDTSRTPGGSSGGSAAAVAGGMVPVAHGSDGAGSIRIPAACCGLVGLKPARGRISRGPDAGDSLLVTDGVLSRTVADTAALLDVLSGYEPGDATWAPPPSEPFAESARSEPGRLRVALIDRPPIDTPVDPLCRKAVQETARLLGELGHEVEEADPPWGGPELLPVFTEVWAAMVGIGVAFGGAVAGREPTEADVESLTWELYRRADGLSSVGYMGALVALQGYARALVSWAGAYDALLTPALAQRPVPVGSIDGSGPDPMAEFAKAAAFTPYTAVANLMGVPAMSLPLFHGEDGLPLAVQLIGRPAGEARLLSLAAQLEAARPWAGRLPEVP